MSAQPLHDLPARERIAGELEANLCAEAAAGTGKTTVLVGRVVNLLASGCARVLLHLGLIQICVHCDPSSLTSRPFAGRALQNMV